MADQPDNSVGNQPAYPLPQNSPWGGMTLRDDFAKAIATGLATEFQHIWDKNSGPCDADASQATYQIIARRAYAIADAMLEERDRT